MVQALNPKNASVLIVEDNPDDAFVVAKALETFGIRHVYAVDTAEDAIALLARQTCDVALVDYSLPRMNGLTLLQRLREASPDLKVIIVTGNGDDRVATSLLKAGAFDYVTKDDSLTSGIVRSLQAALRQEFSEHDARRQSVMEGGAGALAVAREEADWLLGSFEGQQRGDPGATGGMADWLDVVNTFGHLITESMRRYPEPALRDEDTIVRMFVLRGASPTEMLKVYRAALRMLALDERALRINPIHSLVRVYAHVISEYQMECSIDAARRAA